jgi:hypothetical protein
MSTEINRSMPQLFYNTFRNFFGFISGVVTGDWYNHGKRFRIRLETMKYLEKKGDEKAVLLIKMLAGAGRAFPIMPFAGDTVCDSEEIQPKFD